MKTKKIVSGAAVAFLVMAFFVSGVPATRAALSTNASANVVVGQQNMTSNSENQGVSLDSTDANQLNFPRAPFFDGKKFFVVDQNNNRVLVYNSIPTADNTSADVVIGQPNMTSNGDNRGGAVAENTLSVPSGVFSDGKKLFVADAGNNRVLIYNSIPTANNASADVVIGQPNMTSNSENQGSTVAANTLYSPTSLFSDGKRLFVSDWENNRVLIFNSIPTVDNANADVVIGQPDMTSNGDNQGGTVAANKLFNPNGIWGNGKKLFIADQYNSRILIYDSIPTTDNANADVVIGQPDMTSNSENQGSTVAANTLNYPTHVVSYGPKLLVLDSNSRLLVFNSIPTANNASADVVIGQPDMTSGDPNQGGASAAASTLYIPRGFFVGDSKLMIGDFYNNRVLVYNSFGSQWTIAKSHAQILSGNEKVKVKKSKLEFSGKKAAYKKGWVRIFRNNKQVRKVKIKNSGRWSAKFKDTGSTVKDFVIKYYSKNNILQMNSETYTLGINRGSLSEATLEKMSLSGTENIGTDNNAVKISKNHSKIDDAVKGM
ncbi:MAG: hypothetical protein NT093_03570 [Candidatus Moranbacteria bacterium]|nr:hypothetical protein [Candidatus Moranbacteria bacterium]